MAQYVKHCDRVYDWVIVLHTDENGEPKLTPSGGEQLRIGIVDEQLNRIYGPPKCMTIPHKVLEYFTGTYRECRDARNQALHHRGMHPRAIAWRTKAIVTGKYETAMLLDVPN